MSTAASQYKLRTAKAQQQFAAYMRTPVASYTAIELKRACEGQALLVNCPSGYTVDVQSGFYGRTTRDYCGSTSIGTTSCKASSANAIIHNSCQGRQWCRVSSSNAVFGDPCVGTYKYMEIRYRCKTFNPTPAVRKAQAIRKQAHVALLARLASRFTRRQVGITKAFLKYQTTVGRCAYATSRSNLCQKVRCGRRRRCTLRRLRFIGKIAYRPACVRKPRVLCGKVVCRRGLHCVARTVRRRVGALIRNVRTVSCEPHPLCKLARCGRSRRCVIRHRFSRAVRSRIAKRLKRKLAKVSAAYAQRRLEASNRHQYYLNEFARKAARIEGAAPSLSCEHKVSALSCPSGFAIDVLSAFYGRTSGSLCRTGPIRSTSCTSVNARDTVRRLCQSKQSCSVGASNSVFGDPCVGTFKYMEIKYQCRSTGPTPAQLQERSDRIQKYNALIARLGKLYGSTTAKLQRGLRRAAGLKARCVRRRHRRGLCRKRRCSAGRACVVTRSRRRRRFVARCVKPRALCARKRCSRGNRCVVRRRVTKAGRRFRSIRRKLATKHRSRRSALKASFRRSRKNARAAFKLAAKAAKLALARALKSKRSAAVKSLKKARRQQRRRFVAKLRKQRRSFRKAMRRLRSGYKREVSRQSRKYSRRRLVKHTARCVVNRCFWVSCKAGFSCRHVRRLTKKFKAFLQQRRILFKAYWASRRKLIRSLHRRTKKNSKQLRKFISSHRSGIRRAKKAAVKRKLRAVFRRRLRTFRRARRATYRRYRRAAKQARKSFVKKLKALLRNRQGKSALRKRVKTVTRCIPKARKSCKNVKCSAGKRCVRRRVSRKWYRLYRKTLKSGNRRLRTRLLRSVKRLRRHRRQQRKHLKRRRRRAVRFSRRRFGRLLRRLGLARRSRKRVGRSKRSARLSGKRTKKPRSHLWGRFRRAARRYRKKFRRVARKISKRRLRKYAKSHKRVQKSVFRKYHKNAKKFSRRVNSIKNWVVRKLRQLKAAYSKAKKATSADRKKLKKRTVKQFRKIRKMYRKNLLRAVASFYKRRVTITKALKKRLRRFRRAARHSRRRRFVRRPFCVAASPCKGKCRRGYECKQRNILSKSGRTKTISRCEKKANPCSKVKCSKSRRCVVRRVRTRAARLFRWYARFSRKRFRLRVRRVRRRLRNKRRQRARRAVKKYRKLRRSVAKKRTGKKRSKRTRALRRSLKRKLRRCRNRSRRTYRRLTAKLRRRYRRSVKRFHKRFLRNRRRYQTRAICAKRQINPCSKKRCPKGSRCVVRRQKSRLHKRFRRAVKRHVKRFASAKRQFAKLKGRKSRAAVRKLRRSLRRKLRKVWRRYKRRGAFRRSSRSVARCSSSSRRRRHRKSRRASAKRSGKK